MRESLTILAAAAGAWAIAVLGVATNRPFGAFLLAVALVLFVAAYHEDSVKQWWRKSWRPKVGVSVAAVLGGLLGWYLLTTFNEPAVSTVDEEARRQVEVARKETSDLNAKVAALAAQVKAAMQFQENDKAAREIIQKREEDERRKRQVLYLELSRLAEGGRAARNALPNLKNAGAVQGFDEWRKTTSTKLRSLSLKDCAEAFDNPVSGARIGYGLPPDRDVRFFLAIALIGSTEDCRRNHAQP